MQDGAKSICISSFPLLMIGCSITSCGIVRMSSFSKGEAEQASASASWSELEQLKHPPIKIKLKVQAQILLFQNRIGGLLFGYDIGATSGAAISLHSPALSGTTWFNFSVVQLGLVVSGSLYDALIGSLIVYPIADFLGRRRQLIIAAVLYGLGALITASSSGLDILLARRLLYGLAIGLAMHGAPLYIAETRPSQIRGTLISLKTLLLLWVFC